MYMKILRGTIFGGIIYFLVGWLVYGMLLMGYYSESMNTCMNRPDGEMIMWAMVVSNLLFALLLTLILNWANAKTAFDGLRIGAIFGVLYSLALNLSFLSMSTMFKSYTIIAVDAIVTSLFFGIVGLGIVLLWGRKS
jgi:hypothetical protein